ncbi:mucin-1-like [Passer montanus]|uniref:mucin-1-like n=1 Tax=Passer montanus TaxID=9160 RepID=UPI00195FF16E|nr:mucin-1-like [Passer montanus]
MPTSYCPLPLHSCSPLSVSPTRAPSPLQIRSLSSHRAFPVSTLRYRGASRPRRSPPPHPRRDWPRLTPNPEQECPKERRRALPDPSAAASAACAAGARFGSRGRALPRPSRPSPAPCRHGWSGIRSAPAGGRWRRRGGHRGQAPGSGVRLRLRLRPRAAPPAAPSPGRAGAAAPLGSPPEPGAWMVRV